MKKLVDRLKKSKRKSPKKPGMTTAREKEIARTVSPHSSNFLIINHKRKHRFVNIPKLGVSTLKSVTIVDDELADVHDGRAPSPNALFGYKPNGKNIVALGSDEYSSYTTVGIWRDPADRFYSWYKNKVLDDSRNIYIRKLGLPVDTSIDRSIEFLRFELGKSEPSWMDAHLRPQVDSYNPSKVDIIVDIKDLSSYLESIGVKSQTNINSTAKIKAKPMSKKQKDIVRGLYSRDMDILKNHNDKVWNHS